MSISPLWLGIDVSKRALDLSDNQTLSRRIGNTAAEIAELAEALRGEPVQVIFEATGSYDRLLREGLAAAGVPYVRVNPSQARHFAKAAGFLAKTDAIDARMLAEMGQRLGPAEAILESPERQRLTALNRRRDQIVAMRQQERVRKAEDPDAASLGLDRHLAWLDDEVRQLDKAIAAHIAANATLQHANRLLRSLPGFGPVAATTLLALMPELGHRPGKTIAALAGLAPFNADSGQRRGQRRIRGGRTRVRRALYMAAVTAVRASKRFAEAYARLRTAGKPAKLALIAIARKLIVTANAVLKTQTPFRA